MKEFFFLEFSVSKSFMKAFIFLKLSIRKSLMNIIYQFLPWQMTWILADHCITLVMYCKYIGKVMDFILLLNRGYASFKPVSLLLFVNLMAKLNRLSVMNTSMFFYSPLGQYCKMIMYNIIMYNVIMYMNRGILF